MHISKCEACASRTDLAMNCTKHVNNRNPRLTRASPSIGEATPSPTLKKNRPTFLDKNKCQSPLQVKPFFGIFDAILLILLQVCNSAK